MGFRGIDGLHQLRPLHHERINESLQDFAAQRNRFDATIAFDEHNFACGIDEEHLQRERNQADGHASAWTIAQNQIGTLPIYEREALQDRAKRCEYGRHIALSHMTTPADANYLEIACGSADLTLQCQHSRLTRGVGCGQYIDARRVACLIQFFGQGQHLGRVAA